MNKTGIEYLDFTWNPIHGCSKISTGCRGCWAERTSKRLAGMGAPGYDPENPFRPTYHPEKLKEPLKRKKPACIGVGFMGDLFHMAFAPEQIKAIMDVVFEANWHTFFILTKRPDEMLCFLIDHYSHEVLRNASHVWFGVSIEDQPTADSRLPALMELGRRGAINLWVSIEPMVGSITGISKYLKCESCMAPSVCWCGDPRLRYMVIGCESGPGGRPARPMYQDWARALVAENKAASMGDGAIPIMVKQAIVDGKVASLPGLDGEALDDTPTTWDVKQQAGRLVHTSIQDACTSMKHETNPDVIRAAIEMEESGSDPRKTLLKALNGRLRRLS